MKIPKSDIEKIKRLLKTKQSFLVVAHHDPEGDAIGSTLAVFDYLRSKGKNVTAYNEDPVPSNLRFLANSREIRNKIDLGKAFDVSFILDCSEFSRVTKDFPDKNLKMGIIINIDHHLTSKCC